MENKIYTDRKQEILLSINKVKSFLFNNDKSINQKLFKKCYDLETDLKEVLEDL